MVATLSEFAMPSIGIATTALAASIASGETPLRSPPKDQHRRKYWHHPRWANAGRGLFGNYDPSASGFGIGNHLPGMWALAPGHPTLSTLRRLHEFAFVQFHLRAANHQFLHEKRIAQPEDGADVVVLGDAVEHDRNWSAWA